MLEEDMIPIDTMEKRIISTPEVSEGQAEK